MKYSIRRLLFAAPLLAMPASAFADVNWAQPPVACVEEMVPTRPAPGQPPSEFNHQAQVQTAHDVLLRFGSNPPLIGSPSQGGYSDAFTLDLATHDSADKIADIYKASEQYQVPPQVLAGALFQESNIGDLGVVRDFGNWACGIGQLNLNEWCRWEESLDYAAQIQTGWPADEIAAYRKNGHAKLNICSGDDMDGGGEDGRTYFILKNHVQPLQSLARIQKGIKLPEALLTGEDMNNTLESFDQKNRSETHPDPVYDRLAQSLRTITAAANAVAAQQGRDDGAAPAHLEESAAANHLRYKMARQFAQHCSNHSFGIPAKAYTLQSIFKSTVPRAMQTAQTYSATESGYQRNCPLQLKSTATRAYPLHTGWLMAVAIYNAGEEIATGMQKWRTLHHKSWESITPVDLADGITWISTKTPLLGDYKCDDADTPRYESLFHIRNVINHVTLPGSFIVSEAKRGSSGCPNGLH